ncbi:hypothetical protein ACLB2K_036642 [Fragaria x ananassa]
MAPMMATTCFWDTSSNTFNFKFGQMGITLLDVYAITGLPVSDRPYQESDFEGEEVAFEADPNRRNFYASDLMLNRMYPEALANKFIWCTTHSPEAMSLFEQAISIADLRLLDDTGFELKKEKKQTDDPRFQPKFVQLKVKVRSISFLFASKEVSQTYNAWWSMICGELWTMNPLHLFIIIFANGQTLLPLQDQALFGETAFASDVLALTSTSNLEPVQDNEDEENIPKPCQPSSSQTPQKRRREETQDPEDEERRNATSTNGDVNVLDNDPEEDDHMTLNELLHHILLVCHATPIATMDNSRNRVPFGPVE